MEGCVRGDGDGGDAHDDVRHGHIDQVHPGVHPQARSEREKGHDNFNRKTEKRVHFPENGEYQ